MGELQNLDNMFNRDKFENGVLGYTGLFHVFKIVAVTGIVLFLHGLVENVNISSSTSYQNELYWKK